MQLLKLILIAWLCAAVSVQAHQSGAKNCDDAKDTNQLSECLSGDLTKSNSSNFWSLMKLHTLELVIFWKPE